MLRLLFVFVVGCARLAHVDPSPRDVVQKRDAAVRVEAYCGDVTDSLRTGSGVVISERHVLTAAHVTRCADIPRVYVTTSTGDRHRVYVTREDLNHDIARLELAHAGRFGLNIAPPELAGPWDHPTEVTDELCVFIPGEFNTCGERIATDLFLFEPEPGNSGAAVYDRGYLVGVLTHYLPLQGAARVAIVDATWLEGT